jgi:hypothetical protein
MPESDVQNAQNGTFTNPCFIGNIWKIIANTWGNIFGPIFCNGNTDECTYYFRS